MKVSITWKCRSPTWLEALQEVLHDGVVVALAEAIQDQMVAHLLRGSKQIRRYEQRVKLSFKALKPPV